uniref:Uncharacterized protein n=1 Tax=Romanomermis culicivorax TaxID=13658 RepID=A0A915KYA9_ROMCU
MSYSSPFTSVNTLQYFKEFLIVSFSILNVVEEVYNLRRLESWLGVSLQTSKSTAGLESFQEARQEQNVTNMTIDVYFEDNLGHLSWRYKPEVTDKMQGKDKNESQSKR